MYPILSHFTHRAAAAAAKLSQSCPILCDPIDGSLPGSSVPGIFQARVLEWGAIAFSVLYIVPLQKQNGNVPIGSSTLGYGKLGVIPSCHLVSAQVIRDTLILKTS